MRRASQYEVVFNHLKKYGKITSMEAFGMYGITRLSDVIYRLRKNGYDIESVTKTKKNRYGNVVNYSEYVLK